jgi:ABC-type sugar transport system substrate-binding protein
VLFTATVIFDQPEKPIYPDPEKWVSPTPKKKYVIGACVPMMGAPYWRNLAYGVFSEAKNLNVELLFYDAGGYQFLEKQIRQVEDLIVRKVDAIVICPCSSKGTVEVLERAASNGIIVVNTVSRTYSDKIAGAVLDDDYNIGRAQAEYIDKKFGGKAKGVMLSGPAGSDWSMNRVKGFKEYISNKPGIRVVGEKWSEPSIEVAQAIMDDFLQSFPDMQFCYTAADGMSMGAANAVRSAKKLGQVAITTASFSPEGADYLKKGWISLDVGESPILEGAWAVDVAVKALNGEEYPRLVYVPNPPFTKESFDNPEFTKYFKYQWAPKEWRVPTFK